MYSENNISNDRISFSSQNGMLSGNAASHAYVPYSNLFYPYLTDYGGTNEDISLTVTRIKNKKSQTSFPNERWDDVPSGFLGDGNYTWAFKETFNPYVKNGFISNAFCFNGQKLRIFIEPKGHISGYLGDKWVYTKTTVSVVGTDLFSGNTEDLCVFSDFDSEKDSAGRYFNVEMPEVSSDGLANYLIGGMYILTININYEFYEDATFAKKMSEQPSITSQHNLQIVLFSCSNEAKNVSSPLELFTESVSGSETFDELFEKSVLSAYDGVDSPTLTSDQKRAAIADQIAVLFMSQHPVATSENYPCKIIGYGIEDAIAPKYTISKAYAYARRFPEIIPMVNSRLYGMFLNYKTFAISSELDKYFTDFNQSMQRVRDPSRIIAIKENGRVDFDFGVDGLLFNPFNIETVNADVPKSVDRESIFNVSLKNKNVEITNLFISDPDLESNLVQSVLPIFDNTILTCPTLNTITTLYESPSLMVNVLMKEGQNKEIFNPIGGYTTFIIENVGTVTANSSGTNIYNLVLSNSEAAKWNTHIKMYYSGGKCYFMLEGTKNGRTWKFKSDGYNLTGTYNLHSYSSTDGSPNPYPTETSIKIQCYGELQREWYEYKKFKNNKVKVSFEPLYGQDLIRRIRYSIWVRGTLAWMEYVDETGSTTSHTFDLSALGGISQKSINGNPSEPCDIINVKIDVEDAYGFVNSFYQDYFIPDSREYPSITSISGNQSLDGTGSIDIYYNYIGASEINNTKVSLKYSLDNSVWKTAENHVYGDVGRFVQPGFRRIKWNPWNEVVSASTIYVKVSISDVDNLSNISIWEDSSIAIAVSIRKPNVDVRILSQDELEAVYESSSSSVSSSSSSSISSQSSSFSTESSSSSFNYEIKNLILFIGDGMGINHQQAASMYKTGLQDQLLWQTSFDVAMTLTTNSLSGVTDSAAAATALATGNKVVNNVISTVSAVNSTPLRTILDYAKENGKLSGLVTTDRIDGATTAAFSAHRTSRYNYAGIVSDYYSLKPNLLMGQQGASDSANAATAGYKVAIDTWAMLNLDSNDGNVWGQFVPATSDVYSEDRCPTCLNPDVPKLKQMVEKSIELLSENENGFFLVAEGALIDHAADGGGDIMKVVEETLDLEEAVQVAYDWASTRNDTMIIVLSDHETGGLDINSPTGIGITPDVTFSSAGHTSRNVQVYAWGPQADDLATFTAIPGPSLYHTDIYRFMMDKLFPMESTSSSSSSLGNSSSSSRGTSSSSSSRGTSSSSLGTSSSSSSVDDWCYWVHDFGTAAVNGKYEFNGIYNGQPGYIYGGYVLQWSGFFWQIIDSGNTDVMYYSPTLMPFNSGDWLDDQGALPIGTIETAACNDDPFSSSSGDIYLTISNSGYVQLDGDYYIDPFGPVVNGRRAFSKDLFWVIWWDGSQWVLNEDYGASPDIAYWPDSGNGYPDGVCDSYNSGDWPLAINTTVTANNV